MSRLDLPLLPKSEMFVGGQMTREWQEFFRQLFVRVGGYDSPSLGDLDLGVVSPAVRELQSEDQIPSPVVRELQTADQIPDPVAREPQVEDQIPEPVDRRPQDVDPAPDFLIPSPKQEEVVWDDIQFPISAGKVPAANFPDFSTFTTNTKEYKFDVNDYIDLEAEEMAHWWKEGTGVWPHLHVALDGANASGASQYAKFTVYLSYATVGAAFVEVNRNIEIEIPNGTADLTHLLGSSSTVVDFSGLKIGSQVAVRIKRIAATGGVEYPNHIFITQVGIHVEKDSRGSRGIATK